MTPIIVDIIKALQAKGTRIYYFTHYSTGMEVLYLYHITTNEETELAAVTWRYLDDDLPAERVYSFAVLETMKLLPYEDGFRMSG